MPRAAQPRSFLADDPFRYVGGHVAADLVNTVNWETLGLDRDRLSDYARVVEWAEGAAVVDRAAAGRLRAAARARRAEADAAHHAARWTRDVVRRVLAAAADDALGGAEGRRALDDLNALLATSLRHLRVGRPPEAGRRGAAHDEGAAGAPLAWSWEGAESRLDALLWPVVWAAAQLLTSPDAAQLRVCAGPDCGWIYVDRSRNGLRRWCEMQTCGTLEKSRRRSARQREHG
jgi:predicted RNA-binding Zn ribbon-like protein